MKKKTRRKRIQKEILHFLIYLFFTLFYLMIKLLPSVVYSVTARMLGTLAFYTMRNNRKRILKNINIAYGDTLNHDEKIRICREIFISAVIDICEAIQASKITNKQLLDTAVFEGEEILKTALKSGRGVVGISAHLNNFPKLQAVLTKKGYPVNYFSKPPSGRYLAKLVKRLISSKNVPIIEVQNQKKFMKEALKCLAGNGILGFYIDQHSKRGVEVSFFNQKVFSPPGAAIFARKCNCPVIGLFSFRMPDGKHKIIIEGPYPLQRTNNPAQDIQTNTAFFMQRIEYYVRQHPEQWFTWLNKRFR